MERTVELADVSLSYEAHGEGPPIVFLHGFPLDRTIWRQQLARLDGFHRIAPDLRGMGASSVPRAGYSMAAYATDVLALLDALALRRVALCGLSMGGYVVMELLRRAPDRVAAVALVDTRAEPDNAEGRRARLEAADRARREGVGVVVRAMLPKLLGSATRDRNPEVVRRVVEMMSATPVDGFVGALQAMRDRPDSSDVMQRLAVPALVVVGAEDVLTPPESSRALADSISDSRLVVVAGAGHLTPVESPDRVTAALAAFFGEALKPA